MHYPPPEIRTSGTELLGNTTSMVITAVVAFVGLVVWLGSVFWTDARQGGKRIKIGRGHAGDVPPAGEVSPGQGERPWEQIEHRHVPPGGHPHGRPGSWVVVIVLLAAFVVGGVSIIAHAWWLFWTCAGIVLLCVPAGWAVGMMKDTIVWGSTPAAGQPREDDATPGAKAAAERARQQAGAGRPETGPGRQLAGSDRPAPRTGSRDRR